MEAREQENNMWLLYVICVKIKCIHIAISQKRRKENKKGRLELEGVRLSEKETQTAHQGKRRSTLHLY